MDESVADFGPLWQADAGVKTSRSRADGEGVPVSGSSTTPESTQTTAKTTPTGKFTSVAGAPKSSDVANKTVIAVPQQSFSEKVQQFGTDWQGVASLMFLFVFGFVAWRTLKSMPKTKPVEIRPKDKVEVAWSDIAGVDDAKKELQEVVDFLKDPGAFLALGARVPAGVLLHGPPGTGKTLLAKAVAAESGATFYSQSASSFVEMFAGLGAARIRRLSREAPRHEPAIVFIDELDAVGAQRGSDNNSEREQTLNQLLVEMDGFASSGRVVVMAASNLLEKLDPALLRPGRFDRQVFVSPP